MNTLILLGLSALLAAEPSVPFSTSTSGSRHPLDIVLEQCAIGSEYGLDDNLLRLYPLGKWDPHAGNMIVAGGYRWDGDPADYLKAIRELPSHIRIALTLGGEASVKQPTDWVHSVALLKHLRGSTQIVEINLSGRLTDADLAEVRELPRLEVLKVTEDPEIEVLRRRPETDVIINAPKPRVWITDAGLAGLKELPALTELTLSGSRVSGVGLAGLTRLKTLTLERRVLTEEGMKAIAQLPSIEQLALAVTDDASLAHLAGLSKLRQLTLSSSSTVGSGITGSGLQYLAGLENLRELRLSYCYGVTASGLESLATLKHLVRLDLRETWFSAKLPGETLDEIMVPVGGVSSLRELVLPGEVGDAGLAHLESLQNLRLLKMYSTRMTDNGLQSVGKMVALEDLSITGPELSDESLAHLRTLRKLRRLSLPAKGITGAGLKYLPEIGRLESLSLPTVTSESLSVLPRLPNLRELTVQAPDDNAMAHVGRCRNLESFRSYGISLGDTGVEALSRLGKLRNLEFGTLSDDHMVASLGQLVNLERLWLGAPNAGTNTMAAIARLTRLKELSLSDVAMTEADVRELRALKNLRRLCISYSGENGAPDSPSDAALASLWDHLPELKINGPRGGDFASKGQPLGFRHGY